MSKKILSLVLIMLFVMSCGGSEKKKLYIFNWSDYIAPELIDKFEEKYNCEVVYDTYNSNENMFTKVMNTQASYDLIVPTADHVGIMIEKDMLEKIDTTKLKNYQYLNKAIMEKVKTFDPGKNFAIPYFWGTSGIIYNKRYISEEKMKNVSWNIFSDPSFTGKRVLTLLDDARSVVGVALIYKGYNVNDMSSEALAAAEKVLQEWDKNVSQYDSESYKNEIQDGTTWIGLGYSGDALQVIQNNQDVGFVLPVEGAELWIDSFVILKNAENKELAYKFIDFILDPQNAKINSEYVQYPVPNDGAFKLLAPEIQNNPLIYPGEEYLKKCYIPINVGEKIKGLNKVWEKIRNN